MKTALSTEYAAGNGPNPQLTYHPGETFARPIYNPAAPPPHPRSVEPVALPLEAGSIMTLLLALHNQLGAQRECLLSADFLGNRAHVVTGAHRTLRALQQINVRTHDGILEVWGTPESWDAHGRQAELAKHGRSR